LLEIQKAKLRFGLPEDTPVLSCSEAGRDGFWLHRWLAHHGITNLVVDPASIQANRRNRRPTSDGIEVRTLVERLMRWQNGERKVWGVVKVPTVEDEDGRQRHRELLTPKGERTQHINRIKGILASFVLTLVVDAQLPTRLEGLRQWDGQPLPA